MMKLFNKINIISLCDLWFLLVSSLDDKLNMAHLREIKYKMKYAPVIFDFKAKKVVYGEEMTAEIIASEF